MTVTGGQIVLPVYAAVMIVAGVVVWFDSSRARTFEATRAMPVDHQIVAGDVRPSRHWYRIFSPSTTLTRDFERRYVTVSLAAGAAIDIAQTAPRPAFARPASVRGDRKPHALEATYLAWTTLPQPRDERIDAGKTVEVCGLVDPATACPQAVVAALDCPPSATRSACAVALWLDASTRAALLVAQDVPADKRRPLELFFRARTPVRTPSRP